MLEKPPDNRLPSVARAATSPTAIVLAGSGVALGEVAHLVWPLVVLLGAVGYGARVGWAAVRRRSALRRRAGRRSARIDPWSVPDPWRGYTTRALDARKRFRELARDCPPGPLAGYIAGAVAHVDAAVGEQWALARSGAALAAPTARVAKVAEELSDVQGSLRASNGADKAVLARREESLAAELRSLRRTESVSTQISARLSTLCAQLEALVASAGELVASAGTAGADLDSLGSELASLAGALDEAKRIVATGQADEPRY